MSEGRTFRARVTDPIKAAEIMGTEGVYPMGTVIDAPEDLAVWLIWDGAVELMKTEAESLLTMDDVRNEIMDAIRAAEEILQELENQKAR